MEDGTTVEVPAEVAAVVRPQVYKRRENAIIDPDGVKTDHGSINAAKRASRRLQKEGKKLEVEKVARKRGVMSSSNSNRWYAQRGRPKTYNKTESRNSDHTGHRAAAKYMPRHAGE